MNWIIASVFQASFMGFVVVFYKILEKYFDFLDMNLGIAIISIIFFSFITKGKFYQLSNLSFFSLLIGLAYGLFCYFFIKSIINYHNPGIISALLRTQIVLTFLIMFLIFKSPFDIKKFIFICLILIGSVVTIINPKRINRNHESFIENKFQIKSNKHSFKINNYNHYLWLIYLILAIIFFSIFDIMSKFRNPKIDINIHSQIVMIGYFLVFLFLYIKKNIFRIIHNNHPTNKKLKKTKNFYGLKEYSYLIITSLLFTLNMVFLNIALSNSPNPSYPKSIGASSILVSLIMSFIIFKEIPNLNQIVGCAIILFSCILIGFIK